MTSGGKVERWEPESDAIAIDFVELPTTEEAPEVEDEEPPEQPEPVLQVKPDPSELEDAPIAPLPPEERPLEAASGQVSVATNTVPEEDEEEEPEDEARQPAEREIPPEWRVRRDGTAFVDFGDSQLAPAPQSGDGADGDAATLRRILNAAACLDLQTALKTGSRCPPIGAFVRYAPPGEWETPNLERYEMMFPEFRVDQPAADTTGGATPSPLGQHPSYMRGGAGELTGRLPDPHPHPYDEVR